MKNVNRKLKKQTQNGNANVLLNVPPFSTSSFVIYTVIRLCYTFFLFIVSGTNQCNQHIFFTFYLLKNVQHLHCISIRQLSILLVVDGF